MFTEWVGSLNGAQTLTKYTNPIYVVEEVLNSILEGEDPDSDSSEDVFRPQAFVKLLDDQYEDEDVVGEDDEGCRAIEVRSLTLRQVVTQGPRGTDNFFKGCKRRDVGWLKMPARYLIPRGYALLMNNGWPNTYIRPPKIVDA